jgi:hypothetical protein
MRLPVPPLPHDGNNFILTVRSRSRKLDAIWYPVHFRSAFYTTIVLSRIILGMGRFSRRFGLRHRYGYARVSPRRHRRQRMEGLRNRQDFAC